MSKQADQSTTGVKHGDRRNQDILRQKALGMALRHKGLGYGIETEGSRVWHVDRRVCTCCSDRRVHAGSEGLGEGLEVIWQQGNSWGGDRSKRIVSRGNKTSPQQNKKSY